MADEVSSIGVKLTLDAQNFMAGMTAATAKTEAFVAAADKAATVAGGSGAPGKGPSSSAARNAGPGGLGVTIDNLSVSPEAIARLRKQIISELGTIQIQVRPTVSSKAIQGEAEAVVAAQVTPVVGTRAGASHAVKTNVKRNLPSRQYGGPVYPGTDYLVGEKRPEIVRFAQRGTVIPDMDTLRRREEEAARREANQQRLHELRMESIKRRPPGVRFTATRYGSQYEMGAYRGGEKIGSSNIERNLRGNWAPAYTAVEPRYQGRGIGSWMYAEFERRHPGEFLDRGDVQTPFAQRMWSDPRRPFGGDPDAVRGQQGMFWPARRWPHRSRGGDALRRLLGPNPPATSVWSPERYMRQWYGGRREHFARMQLGEPALAEERFALLRSRAGESFLPAGLRGRPAPDEAADLALSKARHLIQRAVESETRDRRSGLNAYFKREWGTTSIAQMLKRLPSVMREPGMSSAFFRRQELRGMRSWPELHASEEFTQLGATQGPPPLVLYQGPKGPPYWGKADDLSGPLKIVSGQFIDPATDKVVSAGGYNELGYGFSRNQRGGQVRRAASGSIALGGLSPDAARRTARTIRDLEKWYTRVPAVDVRTSQGVREGAAGEYWTPDMDRTLSPAIRLQPSSINTAAERGPYGPELVAAHEYGHHVRQYIASLGPMARLRQFLVESRLPTPTRYSRRDPFENRERRFWRDTDRNERFAEFFAGRWLAHSEGIRLPEEYQPADRRVSALLRRYARQHGGRVRPSRSLEARALRMFGETDTISEAGYITPSGRMLDFSGRHEASGYRWDKGQGRYVPESRRHPDDYLAFHRNVDHRQAWPLFKGLSGPESMGRMLSRGFVRVFSVDPTGDETGSFLGSIGRPMTEAQMRTIRDEMGYDGYGIFDVHDRRGRIKGTAGNWADEGPTVPIGRAMAMANEIARRRRQSGGPTVADMLASGRAHASRISPTDPGFAAARDWYTIADAQIQGDLRDFNYADLDQGYSAYAAASAGQRWPRNRAVVRRILRTGQKVPRSAFTENVPGYSPVMVTPSRGYGFLDEAADFLLNGRLAVMGGVKRVPFRAALEGTEPPWPPLDSRMAQIFGAGSKAPETGGPNSLLGRMRSAFDELWDEYKGQWGLKNKSEFQSILWSYFGEGADLGSDWARTKSGIAIPRHKGLIVPLHRQAGGPAMALMEAMAPWVGLGVSQGQNPRDAVASQVPFMLASLTQAGHLSPWARQSSRGRRAYGHNPWKAGPPRLARDFAGPPIAIAPPAELWNLSPEGTSSSLWDLFFDPRLDETLRGAAIAARAPKFKLAAKGTRTFVWGEREQAGFTLSEKAKAELAQYQERVAGGADPEFIKRQYPLVARIPELGKRYTIAPVYPPASYPHIKTGKRPLAEIQAEIEAHNAAMEAGTSVETGGEAARQWTRAVVASRLYKTRAEAQAKAQEIAATSGRKVLVEKGYGDPPAFYAVEHVPPGEQPTRLDISAPAEETESDRLYRESRERVAGRLEALGEQRTPLQSEHLAELQASGVAAAPKKRRRKVNPKYATHPVETPAPGLNICRVCGLGAEYLHFVPDGVLCNEHYRQWEEARYGPQESSPVIETGAYAGMTEEAALYSGASREDILEARGDLEDLRAQAYAAKKAGNVQRRARLLEEYKELRRGPGGDLDIEDAWRARGTIGEAWRENDERLSAGGTPDASVAGLEQQPFTEWKAKQYGKGHVRHPGWFIGVRTAGGPYEPGNFEDTGSSSEARIPKEGPTIWLGPEPGEPADRKHWHGPGDYTGAFATREEAEAEGARRFGIEHGYDLKGKPKGKAPTKPAADQIAAQAIEPLPPGMLRGLGSMAPFGPFNDMPVPADNDQLGYHLQWMRDLVALGGPEVPQSTRLAKARKMHSRDEYYSESTPQWTVQEDAYNSRGVYKSLAEAKAAAQQYNDEVAAQWAKTYTGAVENLAILEAEASRRGVAALTPGPRGPIPVTATPDEAQQALTGRPTEIRSIHDRIREEHKLRRSQLWLDATPQGYQIEADNTPGRAKNRYRVLIANPDGTGHLIVDLKSVEEAEDMALKHLARQGDEMSRKRLAARGEPTVPQHEAPEVIAHAAIADAGLARRDARAETAQEAAVEAAAAAAEVVAQAIPTTPPGASTSREEAIRRLRELGLSTVSRRVRGPEEQELSFEKRLGIKIPWLKRAAGGEAGNGLYIVNEVGPEAFIEQRDMAKLAARRPDIVRRIPGASDGARTGMIQKPAWSLFAPQKDGFIVRREDAHAALAAVRAQRGADTGDEDVFRPRYGPWPEERLPGPIEPVRSGARSDEFNQFAQGMRRASEAVVTFSSSSLAAAAQMREVRTRTSAAAGGFQAPEASMAGASMADVFRAAGVDPWTLVDQLRAEEAPRAPEPENPDALPESIRRRQQAAIAAWAAQGGRGRLPYTELGGLAGEPPAIPSGATVYSGEQGAFTALEAREPRRAVLAAGLEPAEGVPAATSAGIERPASPIEQAMAATRARRQQAATTAPAAPAAPGGEPNWGSQAVLVAALRRESPDLSNAEIADMLGIELVPRLSATGTAISRHREAEARNIIERQFEPGPDPVLQQARIRAAGAGAWMTERTPRGAAAVLGALGFGGGVEFKRRQQQYQMELSSYNKLTGRVTRWQNKLVELDHTLKDTNLSDDDRAIKLKEQKTAQETLAVLEEKRTKQADVLAKAEKAIEPTAKNVIQSFGSIVAATSAYGMAFSAASMVMSQAAVPAMERWIDQMALGFAPTMTKVTNALADQARQLGGNVEAALAATGVTSGMSAATEEWTSSLLGSTVAAKVGAKTWTEFSEQFRATLGTFSQAGPQGLYGGYGGVLGTPLLAEQLGGGKGLAEQMLSDILAARGETGFNLLKYLGIAGGGATVGAGAGAAIGALGGPVGAGAGAMAGGVIGGFGSLIADIVNGTVGTDVASLPAKIYPGTPEALLQTQISGAMGRAQARGGPAYDIEYVGREAYAAYESADVPQAMKNLAKSGYAVVDANGNLVLSYEKVTEALGQLAEGLAIPDVGVWAKTVEREIVAQFQAMDIASVVNRELTIPLQYAMQRISSPLLATGVGVVPGAGMAEVYARNPEWARMLGIPAMEPAQYESFLGMAPSRGGLGLDAGVAKLLGQWSQDAARAQERIAAIDLKARDDAYRMILEQPGAAENQAAGRTSAVPKPETTAPAPVTAADNERYAEDVLANLSEQQMAAWMDAQRQVIAEQPDLWQQAVSGSAQALADINAEASRRAGITTEGSVAVPGERLGPPAPTAPGVAGSSFYGPPAPGPGFQEASDYKRFMAAATAASDRLKDVQTSLASLSAEAAKKSWANTSRLALRSISDAAGMLGRSSGSTLGKLQRHLWEIGRASQALDLALKQRQITTQVALAGFQAPGETGEERYMRQTEQLALAAIEQRKLGYAQETFTGTGQEWQIQAKRNLQDAQAAWVAAHKAHQAEIAAADAQATIAVLSAEIATNLGRADDIYQTASGKFGVANSTLASYAKTFGGTILDANANLRSLGGALGASATGVRQFLVALGFQFRKGTTGIQVIPPSWAPGSHGYMGRYAEGYLGSFAGGATFTVGEAGPETVAILRNPRTHTLVNGGMEGSAGPASVTVNINGPVVRDDGDISRLARAVADEVERSLSRKGQLLGLRTPAY